MDKEQSLLCPSFSSEPGSWSTETKDLFAHGVTDVCAGRLNVEVSVEPVEALDKE